MKRKPLVELLVVADIAPEPVCERAARVLSQGGVAHFRFTSAATSSKADMVARATSALERTTAIMIERHGLPPGSYVEVDEESYGTPVAPFTIGRFLLPHQDGGHSSFLTPSRLDFPELTADERVFSNTVYWKRPSHKMFQGFLITNTGDPIGETYYYNTLTLLWDAFSRARARTPRDLGELAAFLTGNLRWSRAHQDRHRSRYVTVGAMLGSTELAHHVMPSGPRAESELWPEQYANLPQLCAMADACPCGACRAPGERLFCHATSSTLGRTWPEFRREYEVTAAGERFDLLVGNNLTQLHAADSRAERTIRPFCIVIDRPDSDAYEQWLAGQWRDWLEAAAPVPSTAGVA